jgi:MFS family permease
MATREGAAVTRALARLIAAQICIHACMAAMRLAAPLMALHEGYSPAAVGVLLALFALTQVFLALPAGRFADRNGLKRPIGLSVLATCASGALAFAFPYFGMLCACALLSGGATGAASITFQRHVGRAAENPTQLKQVFSWLSIGPAISNFIGPFAAGLLIDHVGYRAAFAMTAVLPLASWYFVQGARELPPLIVDAAVRKAPAWHLLREPMFRRLMIVSWFLSSCWDVHTFVVPILGHERGMSASVIGSILGAFAVAATVVRVVLPLLAAWLRESVVITGAMVSTALLFGVYPSMPNPSSMGLCSVLLGFALGSVQPMVMSSLHQMTPEEKHGEALGLRLALINASSVVMPAMFGAVGAALGVSVVFWVMGAVVGAGSRMAWTLKTTHH